MGFLKDAVGAGGDLLGAPIKAAGGLLGGIGGGGTGGAGAAGSPMGILSGLQAGNGGGGLGGAASGLLGGLMGGDFVESLPLLGTLFGQHQAQKEKQAAFDQAKQMYQQQQAEAPAKYQAALQNEMGAFAPVQHVLTKMYGPGAYINLQAPPSPALAADTRLTMTGPGGTPMGYSIADVGSKIGPGGAAAMPKKG